MNPSLLHEFHAHLHARFTEIGGEEMVDHYGDPLGEYHAMAQAAGVVDLSGRGRLCLTGADRQRFLNGQVTNNVMDLPSGRGCHAAIVNAKAKMQSDLYVYNLGDELLLDLEPGYGTPIRERLEQYIIADDVTVLDVAPHYGLWSVLGPKASHVLAALAPDFPGPDRPGSIGRIVLPDPGELYGANRPRFNLPALDLFVPVAAMAAVGDKLIAAARQEGGGPCGWAALEMHRIESGTPRFGQDMNETNLPPEAGLESTAVDYRKGCYIGQEVIARIRTYGQVSKALRGLRLSDDLGELPRSGDKLVLDGKEVGYVTSALDSPALRGKIALGYVRRECHAPGTRLTLRSDAGESEATVVNLPLAPPVQS